MIIDNMIWCKAVWRPPTKSYDQNLFGWELQPPQKNLTILRL